MANKSSRGLKWLTILALAGVATAGGAWYFLGKDDAAPQYVTATVTRGDLTQVVMANGALNPVVNVQVGSQISGRISKLYADFNSSVTQGMVIAEIDPATYKANVQRMEADLSSANASLELAQVEAKRATELHRAKLVSDSEYETAIAGLHQAEAATQIRDAALNSAKVDLSRCTIYSPVDGTVISRNVDVGQTVAASMSAPILFQIANDLAKMQIDANVSEADIGSVEEGHNVNFTVDAFPERKFTGRVRQIRNAPIMLQNVVTYDAVIEVSNADLKLRPGMTADASIITAERANTLKIPNAAFRFRPPEPSTNQTLIVRLLAKIGLGKGAKPANANAVTNAVPVVRSGGTNATGLAANTEAPLTGNEPPEELARRVGEMRSRGEEVPPEIGAKLRELYQSGVLQPPAGGRGGRGGRGGGEGGGRGSGAGGGGGGGRRNSTQPVARTVYVLAPDATHTNSDPVPQPRRVRTGISDGSFTEILEGLREGDIVITSIKLPQAELASAPGGANPFGGGGGGFRGGGGGGGGGGGFRGGGR